MNLLCLMRMAQFIYFAMKEKKMNIKWHLLMRALITHKAHHQSTGAFLL